MCTPSVQCKIVIIAVLMVMRGMEPHMINGTWDEFLVTSLVGLGSVELGLLGWWSVTVRLHEAIEVVIFEEMRLLLVY
jgi:hypothetical protein